MTHSSSKRVYAGSIPAWGTNWQLLCWFESNQPRHADVEQWKLRSLGMREVVGSNPTISTRSTVGDSPNGKASALILINKCMIEQNIIEPLLQQGLRNKEIEIILGVSSYVVSYWRKKLGFPKTGNTCKKIYDWVAIQQDHSNGMSERQLVKKYGISSKAIYIAKKEGRLIPRPFIKKWKTYQQHRATANEANARYRARIKNQIVEGEDYRPIKEFYMNCPDGYEVDHIIPLSKGGLHTITNLQYLTISENRKKSNKIFSSPAKKTVDKNKFFLYSIYIN